MSYNVITSLAILKVNWDETHDCIDDFVPFVAECIRTSSNDVISTSELKQGISDQFGLRIPEPALKTILGRVERAGYVRAHQGVYRRNNDALVNLSIAEKADDIMRKQGALIARLRDFCAARFNVHWEPEEAEQKFLAYIEDHTVPVLAASLNGTPIEEPSSTDEQALYLIYSFVFEITKTDPVSFGFLVEVIKGRMLADVLLLPSLGHIDRKFQNVEIYLDTTFVLRALGLEGSLQQEASVEVLNLLKQQNALLRLFEHTYGEIRGILEGCERSIRDSARRRRIPSHTLEYLLSQGYGAADLIQIIDRLDRAIIELGIRIKPQPSYAFALGIDETKFIGILKREVKYRDDETLQRDLDSLAAIHRLRGGHLSQNLETCRALFVTTNTALARASALFFREEYHDESVPYCMLDHIIATLAWLKGKKPLTTDDLPVKRIIANCFAAMNPGDILWRKYLRKINAMARLQWVSPNEFAILRYSMAARKALMETTLGSAQVFTEGTVQDILERAQAEVRALTEAELEAERMIRERAESAHKEEIEARLLTEKLLEENKQVLDLEQQQRQEIERQLNAAESKLARQRERISHLVGRIVAYGMFLLLATAVLVGILHLLPPTAPYIGQIYKGKLKWIFNCLFGLDGVLLFAHAMYERSGKNIVESLERKVYRMTDTLLVRLAGA